jgi:hypothetical protein
MCWLEKHNEYVIDNLVPTYLWGNSTEISKNKIPKNLYMKYIETLKKIRYDVTLALEITSQKKKERKKWQSSRVNNLMLNDKTEKKNSIS